MPSSAKPVPISRILAASVAHGVHEWQPIPNGQIIGFDARLPYVHGTVSTALNGKIMAWHQPNSSINFLVNIGP